MAFNTLLLTVILLLMIPMMAFGSARSRVKVTGTTVGPNFSRREGKCEQICKTTKMRSFFTHVRGIAQPKSKTIGAKLLVQKKVTPTLSSSLT
jgi:hypothetical protein